MLRVLVSALLLCVLIQAEARNDRALKLPPVEKPRVQREFRRSIQLERNSNRASSNYDVGNVEVGAEGVHAFNFYFNNLEPTDKVTFSASTLAGSAGYKILKDGCKGVTLTGTQRCSMEVSYKFTSSGIQNTVLTSPWVLQYQLEDGTIGSYSGTGSESYSAYVIPPPPEYEKDPSPQTCQGQAQGSIVRLDSQSLGEEVAIVGVGGSLVYTTENAKQFVTTASKANRIQSFNPEGMSFSLLHYYDRVKLRLFEGSGNSRFAKYINLDGQRVVASSDGQELYYFDTNGRHMTTRYSLTGAILRTFNYTNNKISSIVDAFGNTITFGRNSLGVLTSITSPYGQVTNITTTSAGLVATIKNPMSQVHTLAYKSGTELLEKFTKPGGQYATFTYDGNGKLTRDAGSGGNRWDLLLTLMSDQRTTDKSSALARKETYYYWSEKGDNHRYVDYASGAWSDNISLYNNAGNEYQEENYSERSTTFTDPRFGIMHDMPFTNSKIVADELTREVGSVFTLYNRSIDSYKLFDFGKMVDTVTVNDRLTSTSTYTVATNTHLSQSPQGATATKTIDQFGRTTSEKIGNDLPWTFVYDGYGRLWSKSQGSNVEQYAYNSSGYLQSVTNARNEVTSYTYDLAGKLTQIKLPDNRLIGMTYDANGNRTGITPPSKPAHKFVFNAMDLMSSYQPPALTGVTVKDTTYAYNQDKQLTQITRPDTRTVKYVYGASSGRLEQVQVARGSDKYFYKPWSDRIEQIDSADGIRTFYYYFGKMLRSESQSLTTNGLNIAKVSYNFDSELRVSARVVEGDGYNSTTAITYNGDSVPAKIGNMTLTYSYPSGRLSTTALDRITDSRTYNTSGYLTGYKAVYTPTSGAATTLYSYTLTRDVMGRISGKSETIGGVTTTYAYQYDKAGRLTLVTKNGATNSSFVYDSNGNKTSGVINGVAFTATYDNQDRLTSWNGVAYGYNANGDNTNIGTNTFTYDAYSRLLASVTGTSNYKYQYDGKGRQVRMYSGTTGATTMRRIYENDLRIAAEYNDAGVVAKEYVYGTSVNSPDYVIISGVRYRYIKDHLGSPRLIVKSTDGTIAQRMDYDVLGKVINNTKAGFQAYGFAGGMFISSVGLVKFGARWYDPNTGRWTSKDPIRFDGKDLNLFGYALNDPVNKTDSKGLRNEMACAAAGAKDVIQEIQNLRNECAKVEAKLSSGNLSAEERKAYTEDGHYFAEQLKQRELDQRNDQDDCNSPDDV
ncbi:RHS repeat-associated core domain-containing protein [Bdellovibrio sp. SKB1291214]|uniref:RHS repeat domain-containing protein n=1 Tax=Bdellovibrio sp. SKB1291214 TaxID=1732569 RepID=UPI00223ED67A|nr:RHS repeat-associated core domain-containing protein [Bdellovibrio sp. SKB1291214]UYL08572.1 RHS repeat-associated core domain-containing protein [Bdellovibrio sp. SKB1291214]